MYIKELLNFLKLIITLFKVPKLSHRSHSNHIHMRSMGKWMI